VNSKSIPVPGMIFSVATGFVPVISKITKHENITADFYIVIHVQCMYICI
jgi:hypothetical protein